MQPEHLWKVRVRQAGPQQALAYARSHSIPVGRPVSFAPTDPCPSALELLLSALGGDLVNTFGDLARRRGIELEGLEVSLSGRLNNPLRCLGVIGEGGHPGLEAVDGTLYVSADAEPEALEEIWAQTLDRSPLVHTLQRGATLTIRMQVLT